MSVTVVVITQANSRHSWLTGLRRYLIAIAVLNLIWEFAQMPLYELWRTGSSSEIAFAAVHCTGGDVLIALSSLVLALLLVGHSTWPANGAARVLVVTLLIGFSYTAFSEWLNIEIRQAWAYSDLMPVIPLLNMGLSPALQWIIVPWTAYWWANKILPVSK
jgi:hypothetical protein